MITPMRTVVVAVLALSLGFFGGAWFLSSGLGLQLLLKSDHAPRTRGRLVGTAAASPTKSMGSGWSAGGLWQRADRSDLHPSAGCEWAIEPRPFSFARSWLVNGTEIGLFGESSVEPSGVGMRYTLVQYNSPGSPLLALRPAFFDMEANRYLPVTKAQSRTPRGDGQIVVDEFILDQVEQIAHEKIVYFGIERVISDEEWQRVAAARKMAEETGRKSILPIPREGEPYDFDLTTVDDRRLRTEDFRGKAVVIAVWGSEFQQKMSMFSLKQIRQHYQAQEIEIIGVSFEDSIAQAQATFAPSQCGGSLVLISGDTKSQELLQVGMQVRKLPCYFLIDQSGILRARMPLLLKHAVFGITECVDTHFGRRGLFENVVAKTWVARGLNRRYMGPPYLGPPRRHSMRAQWPSGFPLISL